MTKESSSDRTPLSLFYRCPRLLQGLSLVGGLGVISSGLVVAQPDSTTDTGIVLKKPNVAPAVIRTSKVTPEERSPQKKAAPAATEALSTVNTKPMTPASLVLPTAPMRKPALELAPYAAKKPEASTSAIVVPKKPVLRGPNIYIPDTSTAQKPAKLYINPAQVQKTAKTPFSPTNTYIDRSNSIGSTRGYDGPSAVVLTERSTGCQTVSQNGQLLSGVCGVAPSNLQIPSQQTADASTTLPSQQAADAGQTLPNSQVIEAGRVLPSLQIASSGRALPSLQIASSGRTLLSLQVPNSEPTVPHLETATPGLALQESRLSGVPKLPLQTVADREPLKINPLKAGESVLRATEQMPSSAYGTELPLASGSLSDYSTGGSTTSGLDYYYLTARPEGRPSIGKDTFMFPLTIPAPITSLFGWRIHPITGDRRFHAGTDLGAPIGTPVLAAVSGQVLTADFVGGYGLTVILQHGQGTDQSLYGHLSEIFVKPGEQVEQGNVIGRVGNTGNSTGPHLHFEWRHLTPGGWVAVDAGAHLEYALAQFIRVLQIAQATPQRGV